ncbi:hypothetical protein EAW52_10775 [Pseudomonas sp. LTJR-52]|uniref:hypothetical protein n=1 Tax=Pseudomonas sp. LTJR-52 TaxID=2479392 RepID=UPI000EFC0380|nr:hypothetical protein [Pseudomonas sp. LTJR-52]AYN94407.1 hypothetical protein EAW52_10775 [Pseudomonas sp. LTJR-52]
MTGLIINNGNPSAVTVDHDGVTVTFKTFAAACEYADKINDEKKRMRVMKLLADKPLDEVNFL